MLNIKRGKSSGGNKNAAMFDFFHLNHFFILRHDHWQIRLAIRQGFIF